MVCDRKVNIKSFVNELLLMFFLTGAMVFCLTTKHVTIYQGERLHVANDSKVGKKCYLIRSQATYELSIFTHRKHSLEQDSITPQDNSYQLGDPKNRFAFPECRFLTKWNCFSYNQIIRMQHLLKMSPALWLQLNVRVILVICNRKFGNYVEIDWGKKYGNYLKKS